MKVYKLQNEQFLDMNISDAWKFFSNPNNLNNITPQKMNFRIQYPIEDTMFKGQLIVYKISPLLSIPITWITEITQVEDYKYFIDEQRFGPYKLWHHQHIFIEQNDGVLMRDIVHYALPLGFIGRILNFLIVKNELDKIFNFRTEVLDSYFNS